jgi:hypothetical protein
VSIEAEQVFYASLSAAATALIGQITLALTASAATPFTALAVVPFTAPTTSSVSTRPAPQVAVGISATLTVDRQVASAQTGAATTARATLSQAAFVAAATTVSASLTSVTSLVSQFTIVTDVTASLGQGLFAGNLQMDTALTGTLDAALALAGATSLATTIVATMDLGGFTTLTTAITGTLDLALNFNAAVVVATDMTGSTNWTPTAFGSALAAWYDFDDTATLTLVSTAISAITSKGSVSRTLTQATSTARPTTQPTGLNGRRTASYDGSDSLNAGSISVPGQNYTIFVVASPTNNDPAIFDYGLRSSLYRTASGNVNIYASNQGATYDGTKAYTASVTWGTGFKIMGIRDTSTANTQAWVDGTSTDFGVNTDRGSSVGPTSFALGSWGDGSGGFMIGGYAEYIEVTGDVSIADKERIEGYLAHKWGLTANLPAGHPYKTNPP